MSPPRNTPQVDLFASATSVDAGEQISFYVSTNTKLKYSLQIFRIGHYGGAGGRAMPHPSEAQGLARWTDIQGQDQPSPTDPPYDCSDWLPTRLGDSEVLTIPSDWVSGVYVAKVSLNDDSKQTYILFVVRADDRRSTHLMQLSVNTYQAYNFWGGRSYYRTYSVPGRGQLKVEDKPGNRTVSYNRPYIPCTCDSGRYGTGAGQFFTSPMGAADLEAPLIRGEISEIQAKQPRGDHRIAPRAPEAILWGDIRRYWRHVRRVLWDRRYPRNWRSTVRFPGSA